MKIIVHLVILLTAYAANTESKDIIDDGFPINAMLRTLDRQKRQDSPENLGVETLSGNDPCAAAWTCQHDGNPTHGIDSSGKGRQFIDSCDILEYNCIYKTDFKDSSGD